MTSFIGTKTIDYMLKHGVLETTATNPMTLSLLSQILKHCRWHPHTGLIHDGVGPEDVVDRSSSYLFYGVVTKRVPDDGICRSRAACTFGSVGPGTGIRILIIPGGRCTGITRLTTSSPARLTRVISVTRGVTSGRFRNTCQLIFGANLSTNRAIFRIRTRIVANRGLSR